MHCRLDGTTTELEIPLADAESARRSVHIRAGDIRSRIRNLRPQRQKRASRTLAFIVREGATVVARGTAFSYRPSHAKRGGDASSQAQQRRLLIVKTHPCRLVALRIRLSQFGTDRYGSSPSARRLTPRRRLLTPSIDLRRPRPHDADARWSPPDADAEIDRLTVDHAASASPGPGHRRIHVALSGRNRPGLRRGSARRLLGRVAAHRRQTLTAIITDVAAELAAAREDAGHHQIDRRMIARNKRTNPPPPGGATSVRVASCEKSPRRAVVARMCLGHQSRPFTPSIFATFSLTTRGRRSAADGLREWSGRSPRAPTVSLARPTRVDPIDGVRFVAGSFGAAPLPRLMVRVFTSRTIRVCGSGSARLGAIVAYRAECSCLR
jgi:hypothetical protein